MKKLLILGAGIYQAPLIQTARRMGIYTIVSSIPGDYPGFAYADKVYPVDTVDIEGILKIAREEKIDGIVTAGTDVCVITIGKVCDELGLKGLSEKAAVIASNKAAMKDSYEKFGVNTARYRRVSLDEEDLDGAVEGLEFPLIFKSVDSSGSRGITRVDSRDDFDRAREEVIKNTKSDHYIIEEFIEGDEFGAQAFVQDGNIDFILPHGDYVFKGDTGVPVGHYAPFDVSDEQIEEVKKELSLAIRAMELDNCAINADFIMKDGKVYVLEIGGRSGATCLAELTSIYFGFDYYEKIIELALGMHVDFPIKRDDKGREIFTPNASMLLTSEKEGMIVSEHDGNKDDPDIVEVQFDYKVGHRVRKFHVGPDRIGHVITKGETLTAAVDKLHEALSNIEIEVE